MTIYLCLIFIALIFLAFFAEWAIIKLAYKKQLFDKPNERKIHSAKIPRLGGIVFFPIVLMGLLMVLMTDSRWFSQLFADNMIELLGIVSAVAVVFVFGLTDDIIGIRYRNKFLAQLLSGIILCSCGIVIDNLHGFIGIGELPVILAWGITIFAVIYVSNAINFIDGIDGLAGGLSIIALCYYAIFFMRAGLNGVAMICGFLITALIALLAFNLFGTPEKTKVFMGDAGSLSLGVLLCISGILVLQHATQDEFVSNHPFVVAIAPLALPCFDVVRVVVYRMNHGKNIFVADKSHIHHKLLRLGLSQTAALICILSNDLFMIAVALLLVPFLDVNLIIIIEILIFAMEFFYIDRKSIKIS